jgi:NADH-quinone oxidoreductase subunit N
LLPIIILISTGLLGLFSEIFSFKKPLIALVMAGLIVALFFTFREWNVNGRFFNEMMIVDNFSLAFSGLMIVITLLWLFISPQFFVDPGNKSDHIALILFTLIGGVVMVSFNNMLMLFLGLEILSISMYILAGSSKTSLDSNEAALKYFLIGAFSTCFLLFGIALIYGVTGSFNLDQIASSLSSPSSYPVMVYAGILLIMTALAFKVSSVPFHFWAPDVYQGSPTVITAYMSTVVKTAAFAAFFRLFIHAFSTSVEAWTTALWFICAATIIVGNITAVYQQNVKRMLAYSSISHAGYMLLALLALNNSAAGSLFFYTTAYSVSSLASFAILLVVSRTTGSESISAFNGLARKNPLLGTITVIAMLSLAGIPPTAGFFAKYYIFSSAIQNGLTSLVIIAIAGSLIGVFYYFRIITALFKEEEGTGIIITPSFRFALIATSAISLILGIAPGLLTGLI